ncbi:DUF1028 domain-containing protein [Aquimarina aquimarini]|uniref:DUF1028 domain-containing protein n=1 Tax=Aquimarina aquimarini TaxID=1191734 RepID=UPI000D54AFA8|nr:DUF1028 domain-containing protein [Aquimarina aquimarini]
MKFFSNCFFLLYLILCLPITLEAQHTFSIVAVDPETGEIGSAGATCINSEDGARDVSDIVLGVGAINTQAFWIPANQQAATKRMEAGDSPEQIIQWLVQNGEVPDSAQYIIADLNGGAPRTAGYTGDKVFDKKLHIAGSNYAIAGNILLSKDVILDMEKAFLQTEGTLADKLMAALQGAKRPGADSRCLQDGVSSGSAYLRVAKPSDTDNSYGKLSLDLNVWITTDIFEPIDALQKEYDNSTQCTEVTLKLKTDNYPEETSWEIQDKNKKVVASGGPYNKELITIKKCLPFGDYTFIIKDTYGDGICCRYGRGNYRLTSGERVLASGGSFRYSEKTAFSLQNLKKTKFKKEEVIVAVGEKDQVTIYPNPATNIVTIKSNGNPIFSYEIRDAYGKLIEKRENKRKSATSVYLDVVNYNSGVYFVTIYDEFQKIHVDRLIVR